MSEHLEQQLQQQVDNAQRQQADIDDTLATLEKFYPQNRTAIQELKKIQEEAKQRKNKALDLLSQMRTM